MTHRVLVWFVCIAVVSGIVAFVVLVIARAGGWDGFSAVAHLWRRARRGR